MERGDGTDQRFSTIYTEPTGGPSYFPSSDKIAGTMRLIMRQEKHKHILKQWAKVFLDEKEISANIKWSGI